MLFADDHGNDAGSATPVETNSTTSGAIEVSGDVDFFSFEATAGRDYTFATTLDSLSDSVLTLYDQNGTTRLEFDDDGGPGLASHINWTATQSGTYFVAVGGWSTRAGSYTLGIDESSAQSGEIHGVVWNDWDGDGDQDLDEPGIADWPVYLDLDHNGSLSAGDLSTTTDTDGRYSFLNLEPGTYTVAEDLPDGWVQTYPASDSVHHTGGDQSRLGQVVMQSSSNEAHGVHSTYTDEVFVDADGNEFYVEPEMNAEWLEAADQSEEIEQHVQNFPLPETFSLHSHPGATKVIYLDFDGHTTSGTSWNSGSGPDTIVTPAYSLDNDSSFSNAELETIQRIWERVSEDFLPFDVDVTTEDPGAAALTKSGGGDTEWGIRVVIGENTFYDRAGGVAYINSFNWNSDTPCFVFNNTETGVAEAASHEAGHALGLRHDGTSSEGYYRGHGSGATGWAPIMGVGYSQSLVQWSRGEYDGANNREDDLDIITTRNGFGYRTDDHGDSITNASILGTSGGTQVFDEGLIERNSDVDYFSFSISSSTIDLDINPFHIRANLDLLATLYNQDGSEIASSNPTNQLDAGFNLSLPAGTYYVSVEGVGMGSLSNGYSDYGSLGYYSISGTFDGGELTGRHTVVLDQGEIETGHDFGNNAVPTTSGIGAVNVPENAADTVIDLFAAFDDIGAPDSNLSFSIHANSNPNLFTSTNIDQDAGTLTLDYAPNTVGMAELTVRAIDQGGQAAETSFSVTVTQSRTTEIRIPTNLRGEAGGIVTGSIQISDSDDLAAGEFNLSYNTELLDVSSNDVRAGSLISGCDLFLANVNETLGTIGIAFGCLQPLGAGAGDLVDIDFHIVDSAAGSEIPLDLTSASLNEGQLSLAVTPVSGSDATDGLITVNSNTPPVAENDTYSVAVGGTLSVSAPGLLANDHDINGDELTASLVSDPAHGSLTLDPDGGFRYAPDAGFSGQDSFEYEVCDPDGTCDTATVTLSVTPLMVTRLQPTASGFTIEFNHSLNSDELNLYGVDPADLTLVGASSGPIDGTLLVDAESGRVTFVKTGDLLTPDQYSVTLRGSADGFQSSAGCALDGDVNGSCGGDYQASFTIDPSAAVVVSMPDVVVGAGHTVDLQLEGGIPITLSDASGVESIEFRMLYDPSMLSITEAIAVPADATLAANLSEPGVLTVAMAFPNGLGSGAVELLRLTADVPQTAAYRSQQLLTIQDISVNEGEIAARGDDAVQLVAQPGDTTGNASLSALDAQRILRLSVGLDHGLAAYPLADPVLIADVTGNGEVSALDATRVLQQVVGQSPSELTGLMQSSESLLVTGTGPQVNIAQDLQGQRGQTINVPVTIDTAESLEAAELTVAFDPQALAVQSVHAGSVMDDCTIVSNIDAQLGTLDVAMACVTPRGDIGGSLIEFDAQIANDVAADDLALDFHSISLNEGQLDVFPAPQPGADATDGVIHLENIQQLGTVVSQTLDGTVAAATDRWYQLQAAHGGILTVEALQNLGNTSVQLDLYTLDQRLLASSASEEFGRIDSLVQTGDGVLLRVRSSVEGQSAEYTLRITNMVNLNRGRLEVYGSPGDDDFDIGRGTDNPLNLQVNQTNYTAELFGQFTADPAVATRIRANAGAGNDRVVVDPQVTVPAVLRGQSGDDSLTGGSGNDLIQGSAGADVLVGRAGHDRLIGGAEIDQIFGDSGNDLLRGLDGDDVLFGGDGKDSLNGGSGDDAMYGDEGRDRLRGGRGDDALHGGSGNDILAGNSGSDVLFGDAGNDRLRGGSGHDQLDGAGGRDSLIGGTGHDLLDGGAGNDVLRGRRGNDQLFGGDGNDRLYGDHGRDELRGDAGRDKLYGGGGNDQLVGGSGDDLLKGGHGKDDLYGGHGTDMLFGGRGKDRLYGGHGADYLSGGGGRDYLDGGPGQDRLKQ